MDVLRCSDWPKCHHPLVVVDFSLHFCLRNDSEMSSEYTREFVKSHGFCNKKIYIRNWDKPIHETGITLITYNHIQSLKRVALI